MWLFKYYAFPKSIVETSEAFGFLFEIKFKLKLKLKLSIRHNCCV